MFLSWNWGLCWIAQLCSSNQGAWLNCLDFWRSKRAWSKQCTWERYKLTFYGYTGGIFIFSNSLLFCSFWVAGRSQFPPAAFHQLMRVSKRPFGAISLYWYIVQIMEPCPALTFALFVAPVISPSPPRSAWCLLTESSLDPTPGTATCNKSIINNWKSLHSALRSILPLPFLLLHSPGSTPPTWNPLVSAPRLHISHLPPAFLWITFCK